MPVSLRDLTGPRERGHCQVCPTPFRENDLLEIAALVIAIVALAQNSELKKEVQRLKREVREGEPSDRELELLEDMDNLRAELVDVSERVDFAERMLSRARQDKG